MRTQQQWRFGGGELCAGFGFGIWDFGIIEVKRILRVARRIVCRRVERIETVVFILHLVTICHDESDFAEAADNVRRYLSYGMKFSEWPPAARQGEVRGFLRQGGLELQFLP